MSQSYEMERKYSVPSNLDSPGHMMAAASEDLHAWSIYRQNLNSDFTDSALGSTEKSPLPYGNFQLRDTTVHSILSHPRYGPKSALGSNMYTYLKFGLPRVFPPNSGSGGGGGGGGAGSGGGHHQQWSRTHARSAASGSRHSLAAGGPHPRGGAPRDNNSSGYDSSDNELTNTTTTSPHHLRHSYKQNRKYRSDPDFRFQQHHQQPPVQQVPLAAIEQNRHWNRNKSISEANLLNACNYQQHHQARRAIVAELAAESHLPPRPNSKAESQLSRHYVLDAAGTELGVGAVPPSPFLYPHLQVRALDVPSPMSRGMLLLQNVSFEVRGGEVMAVMATTGVEGSGLLKVLSGARRHVHGELVLNGQMVRARQLRSRVAHVHADTHLCPDLSAQQMLRFHHALRTPTNKLAHLKINAADRINVLIEDLGLEQVRNTPVAQMTASERRRLSVACHLLLDTDIVALDQPTAGMDIFDTFFLVEYLRQWANGGAGTSVGRIVLLTLHPPTYEIFTMVSRVLLISAGRVMFSGRRRDMLPYFALVDYPCPAFKNPSDYYLDLVTLDDLSAEAMLESSQRIEQLAEIFRRKQEPLSEPAAVAPLPPTVHTANCFRQLYMLTVRALFYRQPAAFLRWMQHVMLAAGVSLMVGGIFWDVPASDPHLHLRDRVGFHYTVMCVAHWPLLITLGGALAAARDRHWVQRDIADQLYSRFTYIFTKIILNIIPSIFVWITYLVPSYSMSGLYVQGRPLNFDAFYLYLGYMLLYLLCLQMFTMMLVYSLPASNMAASVLCGLLLMALFMVSGYTVHLQDLSPYTSWLQYISPTRWLLPVLLSKEYTPEAIQAAATAATTATGASGGLFAPPICRNKHVQHQDIIVQCPPPNGTLYLSYFNYHTTTTTTNPPPPLYQRLITAGGSGYDDDVIIAMAVFYGVCFVLTCIGFLVASSCTRQQEAIFKKGRGNPNKP